MMMIIIIINKQTEQPTPLGAKAFFWRIGLTIFILLVLAGPGAELLQTLL